MATFGFVCSFLALRSGRCIRLALQPVLSADLCGIRLTHSSPTGILSYLISTYRPTLLAYYLYCLPACLLCLLLPRPQTEECYPAGTYGGLSRCAHASRQDQRKQSAKCTTPCHRGYVQHGPIPSTRGEWSGSPQGWPRFVCNMTRSAQTQLSVPADIETLDVERPFPEDGGRYLSPQPTYSLARLYSYTYENEHGAICGRRHLARGTGLSGLALTHV